MPPIARTNLPSPTLGGKQLWADVFWYADWRIQQHALTGHHRLLDPEDIRRAWGTREECHGEFLLQRERLGLRLEGDHLVILLHGLIRTRVSMTRLAGGIRDAGYIAADLEYPSTRRGIEEHADQLEQLLDDLEDVKRISFVTHSLGGIVTRIALARDSAWKQRMELGRVVMIAPPSTGAVIAEQLSRFQAFRALFGPPAQAIADGALLAIPPPPCDFGIIAGGGPTGRGWNPWVPGDDDGVVRVDETRLEGASDFLLVRGFHTFIMDQPEVIEATLHFLEKGCFQE